MKSYGTSRKIEAPVDRVWAVLTDASRYPEWDPGIERIEGQIALGETIRVFSKVSPGRAFPVNVTDLVPPTRMVWTGGMPLGLFKGVRTFELRGEGPSSTAFSVREEFTGPLLPLIWGSMPDLTESFESFASGLKARSERG